MSTLFEKTDHEIEEFIEDARHQDMLFRLDNIDPDSMDDWFEKRKQKIYDTFLEEYEDYERCQKIVDAINYLKSKQ